MIYDYSWLGLLVEFSLPHAKENLELLQSRKYSLNPKNVLWLNQSHDPFFGLEEVSNKISDRGSKLIDESTSTLTCDYLGCSMFFSVEK